MGVKYVKKAVKRKSKIGSYPTRFQYVGNMLCLFCSCYKLGRFPVGSIGPSWGFTICLLLLVGLFIGCILYMMQLQEVETWNYFILAVTFTLNLTFMISGIIADPGVSAKTYLYYSKMYNQVDGDATSSDEETNSSTVSENSNIKDDENPNALVQNRKQRKQKLYEAQKVKVYNPEKELKYNSKSGKNIKYCYCYKCNDEVVRGMEHCDICDICIKDSDHHCNFFSKCIGSNNSCYFSGSIVMLILNFIIVAILICHDSYIKVYPNGKFSSKMPESGDGIPERFNRKRNFKQLGIIENSLDDHNEGGIGSGFNG